MVGKTGFNDTWGRTKMSDSWANTVLAWSFLYSITRFVIASEIVPVIKYGIATLITTWMIYQEVQKEY